MRKGYWRIINLGLTKDQNLACRVKRLLYKNKNFKNFLLWCH